jgi:putative ATP-grasp target RiPP
MTTDAWTTRSTPFLLRFSEPIPAQEPVRVKYDPVRQVSLVDVAGRWVDATSTTAPHAGTRVTRVEAETTDDA